MGRINKVRTSKKLAKEMNDVVSRVPLVMVNGDMKGVNCQSVCSDEKHGIFSLVDYLYNLGHRKFALIGGISSITSFTIKLKSLKEVLKNYGIELKDEWIIPGDYNMESGYKNMESLMKLEDKPTAVISINDFVSVGALHYCHENDIKIPSDFSLTGFDNTFLSEVAFPKLTTVSHNIKKVTELAVDNLIKSIQGEKLERNVLVPCKLVIKDSCSKPK